MDDIQGTPYHNVVCNIKHYFIDITYLKKKKIYIQQKCFVVFDDKSAFSKQIMLIPRMSYKI